MTTTAITITKMRPPQIDLKWRGRCSECGRRRLVDVYSFETMWICHLSERYGTLLLQEMCRECAEKIATTMSVKLEEWDHES